MVNFNRIGQHFLQLVLGLLQKAADVHVGSMHVHFECKNFTKSNNYDNYDVCWGS